jgi:5'-methylthioadenosine phosphorylase
MTSPAGRAGRIGVIGGLGLRALAGIAEVEEIRLETPWGEPSDAYVVGQLSGVPVALLARHGPGHRIPPQSLNHRANVWGFRRLGCDALLATADGASMKEALRPADVLVPDQFVDAGGPHGRSFFDEGAVALVSMAEPFCPELAAAMAAGARGAGARAHAAGTFLSVDGPQRSTRAESSLYRSWGVDVVGRGVAAEAKLCREAEICYAAAVLVNGFDSWRDGEAIPVEEGIAVLKKNARTVSELLPDAVRRVEASRGCACRRALGGALVTLASDVPAPVREKLALLTERYWK